MPRTVHRSGNLPAEATSFIGRRTELAEAKKKLTAARLVSLVGPGGVGKTRLAVRVATEIGRRFRGGAWLVELAELDDPALVGSAVLAALDLRDQTAIEPVALLLSHLRDRELLLVLDNCEHLLDATAQLVHELLRAAPGVRVLSTSREPLSVAGEQVLPVAPLRLPSPHAGEPLAHVRQTDSVALFIERAAAASGSFELTVADQAAVVELCRRLDGLPLAIELAAVRIRALAPQQICDRLGGRFELLTGGNRAALPRHQTLRTTIQWSYDLLSPAERTLLTRLAVFAGRFTLADVEAVCCSQELPAAGALDLMSSLLDKSLVIKEDAAGATCYRLHETMREYARLELRERGEEAALEGCCADYYLSRCRQFEAEAGRRLLEWLIWMDLEIDNVRAVLGRWLHQEDPGPAIDLTTSLTWYWITRATTEGVRWLDEVLVRDDHPVAHPWTYFARGFLAVLQNDATSATRTLERGIAAAREAGDLNALSRSLAIASIAATMAGDRAGAQQLLDEGLAVAAGMEDVGTTLMTLHAVAFIGFLDGDADSVRSAAAESVRLSREAGDLFGLGRSLMHQGFAALMSGDLHQAEQLCADGLRVARRLDDRVAQCYLLGGLGCCAAGSREPRLAAQLFGAAESARAEAGATMNAGMTAALAQAAAEVRAALGPARYATQLTAGQRLGRDAASRLALREAAPPAEAAPQSDSDGVLGPREAEVARLVADGLSNREIGARLFISERTVESHVRNTLNKLGFNSRAQIANWMATSDR
ncbi:ATP-binding protein [Modestobacter altitudinis]|uniref:ATP-binding protein n=1 Tax=Modestobacter altitudinis TaxID=2213158 RepID=UPI001C5526D1|nr:LuxR C-terminal-related transcriptional regulator [Modestobacter altitudinis]